MGLLTKKEFGKQALGLHPCLKDARLGPVYVLFRQDAVSLGRTAWGKGRVTWRRLIGSRREKSDDWVLSWAAVEEG